MTKLIRTILKIELPYVYVTVTTVVVGDTPESQLLEAAGLGLTIKSALSL